jgi:hypothetical protein
VSSIGVVAGPIGPAAHHNGMGVDCPKPLHSMDQS